MSKYLHWQKIKSQTYIKPSSPSQYHLLTQLRNQRKPCDETDCCLDGLVMHAHTQQATILATVRCESWYRSVMCRVLDEEFPGPLVFFILFHLWGRYEDAGNFRGTAAVIRPATDCRIYDVVVVIIVILVVVVVVVLMFCLLSLLLLQCGQ